MSKNVISSIVSQVVTIITGFLVQRYVLVSFGSNINGLTSSVAQILSYLVLLEAGITTASIHALYKPIAKEDYKEINGIISATKIKFIKVSCIFFVILGISSLIFPFIIGKQLNYSLVFSITFISGAGSGLSYLFINKYQALLYADDKARIVYNSNSFCNIFVCIFKIFMMHLGFGIIIVQAIQIVGTVIKSLILFFYVKIKYPKITYDADPNYNAISKSKNVFVHQIAGFVNNQTDILLLSIFSTLKYVSLYSVYSLIYNQLNTLLQGVFTQASLGFFGKKYNSEKRTFIKVFNMYELLYTSILFVVLTTALIMTIPFINLYTSGVNDMNYKDNILAWMFFFAQYFNLIRIPSILAINVSGTFKETQRGAIIEAIINLSVSITFFFILGIKGLLLGTIMAMFFRSFDITYFTYKNILNKKMKNFYLQFFSHLIPAIAISLLFHERVNRVVNSWEAWIFTSIIVVIILIGVTVVIQILLFKKQFIYTVKFIKNNILRR
ncbi:lipopolysaccharide biosynthesis protein [Clostridium perfringens]